MTVLALRAREFSVKAEEIFRSLWTAIHDRGVVTVEYDFERMWTVQDLANIEKEINGLLVFMLREMGAKKLPKRSKIFRFDMKQFSYIPDGKPDDKNVIVTIDFDKVLPQPIKRESKEPEK